MEYTLLPKAIPGDLFWWNNPLVKSDNDFETHLLCGRRPVLILTSTKSGFSFLPATGTVRNTRQIQLIGRNDSSKRYNLRDNIISETDYGRLDQYIGQVPQGTCDLVKLQAPTILLNPYQRSIEIKTTISNIPIGRVVFNLETGERYVVTNRLGYSQASVVLLEETEKPDNQDDLFFINPYTLKRYLVKFMKFKRIAFPSDNFLIEGSISTSMLELLNWKLQDMFLQVTKLLTSKKAELEYELDKLKRKLPQTSQPQKTDILPEEKDHPFNPCIKNRIEVPKINTSNRELTNKVSNDIAPIRRPDERKSVVEEIKFYKYFKPCNTGRLLKSITNKEELIVALSITLDEWTKKSNKSIQQYRYFRTLLLDSINVEKAPEDVVSLMYAGIK